VIRGGYNTALYFLEGLDESTDAVFLVGWHEKPGCRGVFSHCFFWHPFIKINGQVVGEGQIAAGLAGIYGAPILLEYECIRHCHALLLSRVPGAELGEPCTIRF
jgi:D-amino peptidase